jgi:hypothetical protein
MRRPTGTWVDGGRLTHLGSRGLLNLVFERGGMGLELVSIRRGGQANMSRVGILTLVAFLAAVASVRADNQVWVVQSWPGDIDLIPCSAWSRSGDGSWVLTGGSVKLGMETMENIGVKGDAAAHKLDRQCGGAKKK